MSDKKQQENCLKCDYCNTNEGPAVCLHVRDGWRLGLMLLIGPRALTNLNPCKFLSATRAVRMAKVMCGLWHAHVHASKHNDNGKCPCVGCFGTHCQTCATYEKYQNEIIDMIDAREKTRCQLCQMYNPQTR